MSRQPPPLVPKAGRIPPAQAAVMARLALALANAEGPELLHALVRETATALELPLVFLAVNAQETRRSLRTLAVSLDGETRPNFNVPLKTLPGAAGPARGCRFTAS